MIQTLVDSQIVGAGNLGLGGDQALERAPLSITGVGADRRSGSQ